MKSIKAFYWLIKEECQFPGAGCAIRVNEERDDGKKKEDFHRLVIRVERLKTHLVNF
jgi:hypothetical protein